ncbi:1e11db79-bd8d-41e3-8ed9-4c3ee2c2c896 [Sclerotinia trifoliorum]|uniref:1e11db79-bd8d-41e3-8ed9-4c3ee2c2c896 n=1 Tax=Sclerotinia trifoliorum TaxID=28548 RepID=A0A8H2ZLB3_9HELO|nr:1e11db79-bd8d-41e3-8ed9-4c3ee2c2c896 [Sclerotinia trifoliorum]
MGIPQKSTKTKTRRRLRDLDQISADIRSPKHLAQHKDSKAAEDLPGLGKWYCIQCAKWYESENSMLSHLKGKPHKRRVKALKEGPYTQRDAEAAIGQGPPDNGIRNKALDVEVEMENSGLLDDQET